MIGRWPVGFGARLLEYRLTEVYRSPVNISCNNLDALPVYHCFGCQSIGLIAVPYWTLLPDVVSYDSDVVAGQYILYRSAELTDE